MKRVIAVANQKGGVGKTTTAVNLAASLAATRRRALLIDLDPQGNATMGCGVEKHQLERGVGDVLVGNCSIAEAIVPLPSLGLALLPSNQDLTAAEVQLLTMTVGREMRLRQALKPVRDQYDVILIDCPPALNMLTVNALVAADSVLVPMQCEYYALEGLSALVGTIEQIRATVNPELEIEGVLRTMFDPRNNLSNEVSAQLLQHFGDKVFRTIIPRNVRLAEAPSFGKPALLHDKDSRGALAYLALAGEMIRREEEEAQQAAATTATATTAGVAAATPQSPAAAAAGMPHHQPATAGTPQYAATGTSQPAAPAAPSSAATDNSWPAAPAAPPSAAPDDIVATSDGVSAPTPAPAPASAPTPASAPDETPTPA